MQIPKKLYFHPMFVHFPQASFPAAFIFFVIHAATNRAGFEVAAYLTAAFGVLVTPFTILTGFLDWRFRYKAYLTSVFKIKITGSFVLLALAGAAVAVRTMLPGVAALPLSGFGWVYAGLLTACVVDCVVLGHYGGRLVFH